MASFDRKDAEAVRRRRATANGVLTYLKAALNHAWRNGLVPSDDAWRRPLAERASRPEVKPKPNRPTVALAYDGVGASKQN